MAVGAGVVDDEDVTDVDFRQFAVNGKFVVVLAEGAGHIVDVVAEVLFLAEDGDVMVCPVHGGTHEVCHAGIEADVVLVGLLLVEHGSDKPAGGAGHGAATFHGDGHVREAVGAENGIVCLMDAIADELQVHRLLLREVGDAHAAAEVHEFQMDAELFLDFHREVEHELGGVDEGIGAQFVGDDHGVEPEALHTFFLRLLVGIEKLVPGEAVFCLRGLADDVIALDEVAGIVAEGEASRYSRVLFQIVDVADVVEVDDGAEFESLLEFIGRSVVGGQHDLLSRDAACLGKEQLRQGTAVRPGTFFLQDLDDAGIGRCLDGEVLAELRRPPEGMLECPDVFADGLFVVDVERGGILPDDFLKPFFGNRKGFFCHVNALLLVGCSPFESY